MVITSSHQANLRTLACQSSTMALISFGVEQSPAELTAIAMAVKKLIVETATKDANLVKDLCNLLPKLNSH